MHAPTTPTCQAQCVARLVKTKGKHRKRVGRRPLFSPCDGEVDSIDADVSGRAWEARELAAETADASMPLRHSLLPFAILDLCDSVTSNLISSYEKNLAVRCTCVVSCCVSTLVTANVNYLSHG
jgi:hypothetical protein